MKTTNFESTLPDGYRQVLYINAKAKKTGIIFTVISLVILAAVMAIAAMPLSLSKACISCAIRDLGATGFLRLYGAFILSMIAYIVLHELVHGIAYKSMTGQKLTFGISWSCAFCGVPNIYTYRKTALVSVAAPLTVFSLILLPLTVFLYFVNPLFYLASAFILGLHLGGCCGDAYVIWLLCAKFKSPRTLMRDTGPEQFFYIPDSQA